MQGETGRMRVVDCDELHVAAVLRQERDIAAQSVQLGDSRESQEIMFDAHERAFAFFKGACTRGIYDNMKTAVGTVFVGKDRQYNRRFLQMCAHHLIDPVACTPA
jgi:transposase